MSDKVSPSRICPALWEVPPPKWDADADDTLVCCHVVQETHDVVSFFFRAPTPRLFRFQPGQFVTFEFTINGEVINRCYTMSSAPTRPDTFSITTKRKPGGIVSNWLHDTMRPGMEVKVLGPAGEFSCAQHPADRYLFLSGGSGITPLMSMARTYFDLGASHDIVFVHSARAPRDIIFRRELDMMTTAMPSFRTALVCERPAPDDTWTGLTGYLTRPMLREIARDFMHREVFCCGPEAYMTAIRTLLSDAGFDMTHYHEESFSFERKAEAAAASRVVSNACAVEGGFRIEFAKSAQTISCRPDQFILDAAKAAGMRLPFSCAQGMCGTCKTKKLSGEVAMTHQGGIRKREIDAGMILPCCSKPLSDVTLER
jgi:glycine betaine catabolism B